jgi:hypothetical protein
MHPVCSRWSDLCPKVGARQVRVHAHQNEMAVSDFGRAESLDQLSRPFGGVQTANEQQDGGVLWNSVVDPKLCAGVVRS